jgi:transcriptional regulator GlxA family with amidase domain
MQKARALLLNTNLSVSEIARQCGYTDEFFFSRTFKKYMDISPARIRHKTQKMEAK